MSTYAIGDVHGCAKALRALLDWVAPGPNDTLVTLGDYVDRGPNTRGVIKTLLESPLYTTHIALKGNHELIMEAAMADPQAREWWLSVGGRETLDSYGKEPPSVIPLSHWRFIREGLSFYETETHIFVHGGLLPDLPVAQQDPEELAWLRVYTAEEHVSKKTVICGHTPQRNGRPLNLGHTICIDTLPAGGGWLTCLETETGRYWQTKQNGKRRMGKLKLKTRT